MPHVPFVAMVVSVRIPPVFVPLAFGVLIVPKFVLVCVGIKDNVVVVNFPIILFLIQRPTKTSTKGHWRLPPFSVTVLLIIQDPCVRQKRNKKKKKKKYHCHLFFVSTMESVPMVVRAMPKIRPVRVLLHTKDRIVKTTRTTMMDPIIVRLIVIVGIMDNVIWKHPSVIVHPVIPDPFVRN
jgi:hypothetical protein